MKLRAHPSGSSQPAYPAPSSADACRSASPSTSLSSSLSFPSLLFTRRLPCRPLALSFLPLVTVIHSLCAAHARRWSPDGARIPSSAFALPLASPELFGSSLPYGSPSPSLSPSAATFPCASRPSPSRGSFTPLASLEATPSKSDGASASPSADPFGWRPSLSAFLAPVARLEASASPHGFSRACLLPRQWPSLPRSASGCLTQAPSCASAVRAFPRSLSSLSSAASVSSGAAGALDSSAEVSSASTEEKEETHLLRRSAALQPPSSDAPPAASPSSHLSPASTQSPSPGRQEPQKEDECPAEARSSTQGAHALRARACFVSDLCGKASPAIAHLSRVSLSLLRTWGVVTMRRMAVAASLLFLDACGAAAVQRVWGGDASPRASPSSSLVSASPRTATSFTLLPTITGACSRLGSLVPFWRCAALAPASASAPPAAHSRALSRVSSVAKSLAASLASFSAAQASSAQKPVSQGRSPLAPTWGWQAAAACVTAGGWAVLCWKADRARRLREGERAHASEAPAVAASAAERLRGTSATASQAAGRAPRETQDEVGAGAPGRERQEARTAGEREAASVRGAEEESSRQGGERQRGDTAAEPESDRVASPASESSTSAATLGALPSSPSSTRLALFALPAGVHLAASAPFASPPSSRRSRLASLLPFVSSRASPTASPSSPAGDSLPSRASLSLAGEAPATPSASWLSRLRRALPTESLVYGYIGSSAAQAQVQSLVIAGSFVVFLTLKGVVSYFLERHRERQRVAAALEAYRREEEEFVRYGPKGKPKPSPRPPAASSRSPGSRRSPPPRGEYD
ncbi:hypothetical protein BESB_047030 [Besnoitia besnoiti]|uniref:Transmembrane protein n=1 Tax=Besnoitia besnoiti TaxID=94643 RepID=A0A2A9MJT2_BESBE|nr:hypothetical protein BESB_047030 [Besnoitia besnoiti]PFH36511.1 hypothetical protein BESB_047030 [Besnoitia besnoiti]